jgi:tetratricopeptide (TPR) repeat protein
VAASDDPVSLSTRPKKVGPELYVAAAQMMENQGKFDEAEAQYQTALKSSPGDLNALVGLARLYDRQGEAAQAVETYRRALKLHPNSALVYNELGLCYARQQSNDQAVQYLTKAVELDVDNVRYRNNLATVLIAAGDTDAAVRHLTDVNTEAVAHYNVACLLQMQGKQQEAVQHLHISLDRDPNLGQARQLLAQMGGTPNAPETRVAAQTVSSSASASRSPSGNTITQPQSRSSFSPWR